MAVSIPKYSYKGVEYEFVDTQVRLLEELKCPICIELVNEPVSTSCSHLFCSDCIKDQTTCPTCRKRFTTTPDRGSVRIVKAFKVKCPNSVEGCEWQGDLGDAEEHLEKKCQHQKVKCPYCDHKGVYKDMTTVHYTTCGDFPLSCPTDCGKKIKRRNMESHLSTECPEEYISCKYVMFGCDTAVKRREKETHFSDDTFHLQKLMELQVPLLQSLSNCWLTKSWDSADVTSLPLSFRPWLQKTPTCYPRPPCVVKLEGFEEKKRNERIWYSDPVYSHFGGYATRLLIYSNGYDTAKGTHIAAYICVVEGLDDDNLKFPFEGCIVVSLLNQLEDKNHLVSQPWSPGSSETEFVHAIGGSMYFIPHNNLSYNSDKNRQYLKNDCLFFRVDKIECVL